VFKTSDSTAKIDAAMVKVQGKVHGAVKDSVNPHFKSKYADLSSVWDACRDALTSEGVSVTQWPVHSSDNMVHMVTRLAHDGEWLMAEFGLPADKASAHGYGSAVTYLRRFCLASAVGVVSDDDDGNAASQGASRPAFQQSREAPRQEAPPQNQTKPSAGYPVISKELRAKDENARIEHDNFMDFGEGETNKGRRETFIATLVTVAKNLGIKPGPYNGDLAVYQNYMRVVRDTIRAANEAPVEEAV